MSQVKDDDKKIPSAVDYKTEKEQDEIDQDELVSKCFLCRSAALFVDNPLEYQTNISPKSAEIVF